MNATCRVPESLGNLVNVGAIGDCIKHIKHTYLDMMGRLIQSAKAHFSLFTGITALWENQPCIQYTLNRTNAYNDRCILSSDRKN